MRSIGVVAIAGAVLPLSPAGAVQKTSSPAVTPGSWISSEDYPPEAIRAGAEGRTVVSLAVDSIGAVSACTVIESSGNKALDDTTCRVSLERGRFNPARDRKGRPISSTYKLPVRWTLPTEGPIPASVVPQHIKVVSEYYINAEGIIASCNVIERVGIPAIADPCGENKPGTQQQVIAKDGRPVSYKVVKRWEVDTVIGD